MRRLISTLAGALLAAGTVAASAGVASAGTTAVHYQATADCSPQGSLFIFVTAHRVNYYAGTPNSASSGSTVRLKPNQNRTTSWDFCFSQPNKFLITNRGLALTSRSSSPGANATVETPGNGGNGFASQQWILGAPSGTTITFQNVKTRLYLRVRNSGPSIGRTVTTGNTATVWNFH